MVWRVASLGLLAAVAAGLYFAASYLEKNPLNGESDEDQSHFLELCSEEMQHAASVVVVPLASIYNLSDTQQTVFRTMFIDTFCHCLAETLELHNDSLDSFIDDANNHIHVSQCAEIATADVAAKAADDAHEDAYDDVTE